MMDRCTFLSFTAIIKLGRARINFKMTVRLKEESHIHLGLLEGE